MRTTAILALLIAASLSAPAADWGKVSWGMSREEVTQQYPAAVAQGRSLVASHAAEILSIPFEARFDFQDDKLVGIGLRSDNSSPALSQSSPDSFRDLLLGKYGTPVLLKSAGSALEGVWRSERSLIKFVTPSTPGPNVPAFIFYYWSLQDPQFNDV